MAYRLHPASDGDKGDSTIATMAADAGREVDYMAVVTFVFMLLDSGLTVEKLTQALDEVATLNPKKDHTIACNSAGRARMAVGLVNAFLLKDSYERGLEE